MDFADVDARIVTGSCFIIIGLIVTGFALKVWFTPPVNRVFLFGPYLTQKGLEIALRGWPMLFLLGMLALAGGVSRTVYWLRWRHMVADELAAAAGLVEAAFSLWAAGALVMFSARTWWSWRKR